MPNEPNQQSVAIDGVPRVGDVVADKYRVERILGIGGMGVVLAATHLHLDERVALKFLLPDALKNREIVQRFTREARACVKIKGEHVARCLDVGALEDGAPFMVMEYLDGRDLARVLEKRGRLPIPEAVDYVLQACEAIAEAHALGIVHRDLKPGNLFLTRRADQSVTVKVLDFGISKVVPTKMGTASSEIGSVPNPKDLSMTQTTAAMGSPLYMSPEQIRSARNVDERTDIWALGIILFEALTCGQPFLAETVMQVCARILEGSPARLRELRPEAPPGLEVIISKCLEKDPDQRFPSVADLAQSLVSYGPSHARLSADRVRRVATAVNKPQLSISDAPPPPSSARPLAHDTVPTLGPESAGRPADATVASWGDTGMPGVPRPAKSNLAAIVGVTGFLVIAAGVGFALVRARGAEQATPALPGPEPAPPPTVVITAAPTAAEPIPSGDAVVTPATAEPVASASAAPAAQAKPTHTAAPVEATHPAAAPKATAKKPDALFDGRK